MCYYIDDDYSRNYYIQDYQGPRSIKEGLIILREKTNLQVRGIRMTVSSDDWGGIASEYTASVTDYYPYGNPHKGGSDYKYSGKYLDRSYGLDLYDFEARRFDAIVPVFDRPDDHATSYYSISPYVYCAGDPVNCIDLDGNDIYEMNYNGDIKLSKITDDSYHTLNRIDRNGNTIASINIEEKSTLEGIVGSGSQMRYSVSGNREETFSLFNFVSENSYEREWCLNTYASSEGDQYMIGTTNTKGSVNSEALESKAGLQSSEKSIDMHSHQGAEGTKGGSGYDGYNGGDKLVVSKWVNNNPQKQCRFIVYHSDTERYYEYTVKKGSILIGTKLDYLNLKR